VKAGPRRAESQERQGSGPSPLQLYGQNGRTTAFDAPSCCQASVTCCVQVVWEAHEEGWDTVEWGRTPGVGAEERYLSSADVVAKEVKQSRRARPIPTESRRQNIERLCFIWK
jgi:hypothetical protein